MRCHVRLPSHVAFFFSTDTATTEIYTLSLHDALPISPLPRSRWRAASRTKCARPRASMRMATVWSPPKSMRSEEHTSELQSHSDLVCRLLLEKKKKIQKYTTTTCTNRKRQTRSSALMP